MKAFVVNLERDKIKRNKVESECRKAGLDYEIFNAVDGRVLGKNEIDAKVHHVSIKYLSKGEIGCSLSHQKIYKKILDDNIDYALILEDDVEISNSIGNFLDLFSKSDKKNQGDVFLLYPSGVKIINKKIKISKDFVFYEAYNSSCTHGYIISKKGAKKLANINDPVILPADAWLWFYQISLLKVYSLECDLVHAYDTEKTFSSIEAERNALSAERDKYQMDVIKSQPYYYIIKYYHKYIRRIFLKK
ncbi:MULTISPECIES: glycosyltransferase family 25 protein [Pectobacterium]|uniref:glycosyltransferase family 25 protein n=1 Tax=Pectobacterium TaxID=122277 RepID=UPI0015DFE0F2|nr:MULTISPECIES: glycosyltransferase family 25 protein [Pectobacterium]MBA0165890.1 glycosyltransferase family 25 protein [Pectobacterium sp. CFBP8739]MCH5051443.1 glycosyltransferase family 25 protein [Pectobacterium aquaticum]